VVVVANSVASDQSAHAEPVFVPVAVIDEKTDLVGTGSAPLIVSPAEIVATLPAVSSEPVVFAPGVAIDDAGIALESSVPEPGSVMLLGLAGVLGAAAWRRKNPV
jgi:hypothetical protein